MQAFYIAVLTIAAVILIMILTTIGVAIRKANQDVDWPPIQPPACPNGWTEDTIVKNKCTVPNGLINSGKIYSTYNADSSSKMTSYKESATDWDTTTINYAYAGGKYTVNITKDVPEVLFTPYRQVKIGGTTLTIGVVDAAVIVKPFFTTTGLTTDNEYDVYASLSDISNRNSAGKATAKSPTKLEFMNEPTVAISTAVSTPLYLSRAGVVTSITGNYTAGSSSVSFTTAVAGPTDASGTLTFKKGSVDFNDATYTRCGKKAFATQYNLVWDGVSNYNKCP